MIILKSHPLLKMVNSYIVDSPRPSNIIDSPRPSNISYLCNFGSFIAVKHKILFSTSSNLNLPNSFTSFDRNLENLTRKDVLENIKASFINKLSNFVLSSKMVSNDDFSRVITQQHCDTLSRKLLLIANKDGKLEKYNLDFSVDAIHKYYSPLLDMDLPMYWNLNSVDMFFGVLNTNLFSGVQSKLLEFHCHVNPEELEAIKSVIDGFVSYYCAKIKTNMFEEFNITYTDDYDQYWFLRYGSDTISNAYIVDADVDSTLTGDWSYLDAECSGFLPSDEAYNNFKYFINIIGEDNSVDISVNRSSLDWVKRLVEDACYLNDDVKNRFQNINSESFVDLYNVLHIDVEPWHIVSIYDTENRFLVDRSTNFFTNNSTSSGNDVINTIDDESESIFSMDIDDQDSPTPGVGLGPNQDVGTHNSLDTDITNMS